MSTFSLTIAGQVTRVVDGDTLEVKIERTLRIRLLDCWAPERNDPGGSEATKALTDLAKGELVAVQIPMDHEGKFGDAMSFGRVLANLHRYRDGLDLAQEMRRLGHATKERSK